jgi:hypothetical protein
MNGLSASIPVEWRYSAAAMSLPLEETSKYPSWWNTRYLSDR